MKLSFAGDLFLGGDLLNKSTKNIVLVKSFNEADKRIVNLEQPISDSSFVEDKCTLFTSSFAVKQLKEMKIDAVNLAHNHIHDKGLEGITETISHLVDGEIGSFGAGEDLAAAKKPYYIDRNIVIFGYCEFDKPYLKQVEVANEKKAGINPLRYDNILGDLDTLKENEKAILYFHWGREHVFLPSYDDIALAKKLLDDERVLLIVGMHPHRPQGYIEHNGKRAYMSLGNFLFPNFYISPPTQIYYPREEPKDCDITRQYLDVFKITYKKWRWINRTSLILHYDTLSNSVTHEVVIQEDDIPRVISLNAMQRAVINSLVFLLSKVYKLPRFIYVPIEKTNSFVAYRIWRGQIYLFHLKQLGVQKFIKEYRQLFRRKFYGK